MKLKKNFLKVLTLSLSIFLLNACGSEKKVETKELDLNSYSLEEIIEKAKEEKDIQSIGMPDSWANWKGTWEDITSIYGLTHDDTDMSSAQEIALFESEKNSPTKDIGDVGQAFGPIAIEKGVTRAYKTSYWDDIPEWAKDKEGHWIIGYTGTMAFIANTNKVSNPPKSFEDLLSGDYKVTVGDVTKANQAQNALLSAAYSKGGDEANVDVGFEIFEQLAEQGRLDLGDMSLTRLENEEIEVGIVWDFNALNYRDSVNTHHPDIKFEINIPQDGAVQAGYATIINKYAPHPFAAALAREYILSDAGQINLAIGYARPIRSSVVLPEEVESKLVDKSQYGSNVRQIKNKQAWDDNTKLLGQKWEERVLSKLK